MRKIKTEDIDFIHVEEVTFTLVMQDGTNVTVSEKGVTTDSFSREQMADDLFEHIQKGRPVEVLKCEDVDAIVFEPDINMAERH